MGNLYIFMSPKWSGRKYNFHSIRTCQLLWLRSNAEIMPLHIATLIYGILFNVIAPALVSYLGLFSLVISTPLSSQLQLPPVSSVLHSVWSASISVISTTAVWSFFTSVISTSAVNHVITTNAITINHVITSNYITINHVITSNSKTINHVITTNSIK